MQTAPETISGAVEFRIQFPETQVYAAAAAAMAATSATATTTNTAIAVRACRVTLRTAIAFTMVRSAAKNHLRHQFLIVRQPQEQEETP